MKRIMAVLVCIALVFTLCSAVLAEEKQEQTVYTGTLPHLNFTEDELDEVAKEVFGYDSDDFWVYYNDLPTALLGLQSGNVNFLFLPDCVINYVMAQNPDMYYATYSDGSTPHSTCDFRMMLLDTNAELAEQLNGALATLEANGTLEKLAETYLTTETPEEAIELPTFEDAPTYRVMVTGDLPPMDYVSVDGKAMGYNLALLKAIADELSVNFEIVTGDSQSRTIMLTSGKADVVFWVNSYYRYGEMWNEGVPDGCIATNPYLVQYMRHLFMPEGSDLFESIRESLTNNESQE